MVVLIDEGRTQFKSENPTGRVTFTSAPPNPSPKYGLLVARAAKKNFPKKRC
jgi:hypothetical protein